MIIVWGYDILNVDPWDVFQGEYVDDVTINENLLYELVEGESIITTSLSKNSIITSNVTDVSTITDDVEGESTLL